jgi:hypothetical protein
MMPGQGENHDRYGSRKWVLLCICLVTPAGFLFKFYNGTGHNWFNNYGGGVLYEVFWCLVVFFIVPKARYITRIATGVFVVTCILETLQLWQPAFLQQIRSTFLGAALLGSTFVWWDFPHYVLGCLLGWLLMSALPKKA